MKRKAGQPRVIALGCFGRKLAGKSEIRNPKSEGRPKPEVRRTPLTIEAGGASGSSCWRARALEAISDFSARACLCFRFSVFGLPSDFGFRISDFSPPSPSRWRLRRYALLYQIIPVLLVSTGVCLGQRQNDPRPAPMDPVEAVQQARALVSDMLAQRPDQNTTNTGRVRIRDAAGKEREIPVRFEITGTPTGWASVYETLPSASGPGGMRLTVIHSGEQPNRYELINPAAPGATNVVAQQLAQDQIMAPFAGSDFWIADLGLEFLHWPKQRLLRKEMRHSKFCYVLESVNPQPVPGGYTRVVSWLIFDPPHGIVHADAYDARGDRIKQFDPKSLEKVEGEYQLESMEIRSRKAGTRTVIEFDLGGKQP